MSSIVTCPDCGRTLSSHMLNRHRRGKDCQYSQLNQQMQAESILKTAELQTQGLRTLPSHFVRALTRRGHDIEQYGIVSAPTKFYRSYGREAPRIEEQYWGPSVLADAYNASWEAKETGKFYEYLRTMEDKMQDPDMVLRFLWMRGVGG